MSHSPLPPDLERSLQRRRQATMIKAVIVFLILSAVIVGGFVTIVPLGIRLLVAGMDLSVAAVLFVVLRQKFS
jgi:hypothetical protein